MNIDDNQEEKDQERNKSNMMNFSFFKNDDVPVKIVDSIKNINFATSRNLEEL